MPGFEVFGEEEKQEISDVLETGVLFRYEFDEQRKGIYKVKEFEKSYADYTGAGHAQAVTSGSTALKVALTALGIGEGDEVITQCFTFVATWEAILEVGAIPVFCEIDETLNLDPNDLENKITEKTRCIIPVHMLGAQADIKSIIEIAEKHNIPVLEDTAQAAGGTLNGKYLGTFGKCGTFSFDSVKTMTTGEGGMIITDDEDLWRKMSEYHDHGHDHAKNPGGRGGEGRSYIGFNFRMMELQGAIGLAQLRKLDSMIAAQKESKEILKKAAGAIPGVKFRKIMDEKGDTATFFAFTMKTEEHCEKVASILKNEGVPAINFGQNTWHFYPKWEHLIGAKTLAANGWPFKDGSEKRRIVYDQDGCPQSVDLISRTLIYQIPIKMSKEQLEKICTALKAAASA